MARSAEEKAAYADYIRRSPVWWAKRTAVVDVRAGGICEFEIPAGYDGRGPVTKRCTARAVHCHHKTYDNLFDEPLEDLQALCDFHHKVAHVVSRQRICRDCGEHVFFGDPDVAAEFVEMNAGLCLEDLYNEMPRLCPGCEHFAEKDGTAAMISFLTGGNW